MSLYDHMAAYCFVGDFGGRPGAVAVIAAAAALQAARWGLGASERATRMEALQVDVRTRRTVCLFFSPLRCEVQ